jgi:hypothetical protein
MRFHSAVAGLGVVFLLGCAGHKPKPTPEFKNVPGPSQTSAVLPSTAQTQPAPKIVTPDTSLRGKVASFNEAGRFVVLQFPLGQMPANGQQVFVYRNNLKVGEVKITGPRRDDRTVGDLTTGEAQRGDEVRRK